MTNIANEVNAEMGDARIPLIWKSAEALSLSSISFFFINLLGMTRCFDYL